MEPNLHQLRIFCTVVESGGFSRAAERLYISQPAVSAQVHDLEQFYGMRLIERSGRPLRLSEAGQVVFDYGRRLLALAEEMRTTLNDLEGLATGRLLVGASTTLGEYILPPILGEFKRRYPSIDIELEIANTSRIVELIVEHSLDIGLIGDEEAIPPQLRAEPYQRDDIVVIVPTGHRFLTLASIEAGQLEEEQFILREPGSATRKYAEKALAELGLKIRVAMELGSNEAVKRAVAAGLGIGMLSRYAVDVDIAAGRLAVANVRGLDCHRNLCIVYRRGQRLTRSQEAFLGLLREPQG